GASAAAISSPSIASSRPRSRPISPTICGSSSRATPMPWPIGLQQGSPPQTSSRCGRSRPTRCSSPCRRRSTRGSRRRERAIIPGRPKHPTAVRRRATERSCASSPRLPPPQTRSTASWRSRVLFDATPTPKLRPIPGYRCRHTQTSKRSFDRAAFRACDQLVARTQVIRSGGRVLKQRVLVFASILAFPLAAARAGLAQPGPPPSPGPVYRGEGMILPPYEVAAIVRSTGLEPLGRPVRQGQAYAVRAIDDAGEEVRVIVDARLGRIIKVVPLMEPRYAMPLLRPPAFGRPPRPVAMVPDGGIEGPLLNGPAAGGLGPTAGAPHEPPAPAGPPLPRPRPKMVSTESPPTGAPAPQPPPHHTQPTQPTA